MRRLPNKFQGQAIEAIRHALEDAGVQYFEENGSGPGIRLKR